MEKAAHIAIQHVNISKEILSEFRNKRAKEKLLEITDYITIGMLPEQNPGE